MQQALIVFSPPTAGSLVGLVFMSQPGGEGALMRPINVFDHRNADNDKTVGVFDMPNPYRYDILWISIFCKIS